MNKLGKSIKTPIRNSIENYVRLFFVESSFDYLVCEHVWWSVGNTVISLDKLGIYLEITIRNE